MLLQHFELMLAQIALLPPPLTTFVGTLDMILVRSCKEFVRSLNGTPSPGCAGLPGGGFATLPAVAGVLVDRGETTAGLAADAGTEALNPM